jgi:hypothetical protein
LGLIYLKFKKLPGSHDPGVLDRAIGLAASHLRIGGPAKEDLMSAKISAEQVQALIPRYWRLLAATTNDVVFFGQVNIRQMIRSWRGEAASLAHQIKATDEMITFMAGKTAASFIELAQNYEYPGFPKIGILPGNWSGEPEPIDPASINREGGKTTFNVCGWCKHASCGSCRYNYYISTSCGIKTKAGLNDEERYFNTPCFLIRADSRTLDEIRDGLQCEKEKLIAQKRDTDSKIRLLFALEKRAEKKPALPNQRPYDWFNINDPVVCFIGNWEERLVEADFATAKVINGYRHHDGCVSICFDVKVHDKEYLDGYGNGYGMSRPEIMHVWEFEYLLDHPEFASVWHTLGTSQHLNGYDPQVQLGAFAREAVRLKETDGTASATPK